MTDSIRYSTDYLRDVRNDAARSYLAESGIPRVEDFLEDGPLGVAQDGVEPELLMLGYVGDPSEGFYLHRVSGAVLFRNTAEAYFVNSSPQQFVASFQAYLDITYGGLAGQDKLVEQRLREELRAIDPAAIEDEDSFWNDTLGDVAMGVYGDDTE